MSIGAAYALYDSVGKSHDSINSFVNTDQMGLNAARYVGEGAYNLASGVKRKMFSFTDYSSRKKQRVTGSAPEVSQKKVMPKGSGVNALAGRASMVKKGHIKPNQKKKVKVSKTLRKKINAVMKSKKLYGEYHKSWNGAIGTFNLASATPTGSINTQTCYLAVGPYWTDPLTYNYTHFNALLSGATDASNPASYVAGKGLVFFTPLKFLDAASVLWNQKGAGLDYTLATSNLLTTREVEATGVPSLAEPPNLKLDIVNSFVTFEIKNVSQRAQTIVIHHCTPKVTSLVKDLISVLTDAVTGSDAGNNGPIAFPAGYSDLQKITNPLVPWSALPTFNNNYKYEKISIIIKPGETCKHSLQGPKNYTMDYAKLVVNGSNQLNAFYKGSVFATMSIMPDAVLTTTPSNVVSHAVAYATSTEASTLRDPVIVEVVEHYKLAMPEPVGFTENAGLAGTQQILNMRRPRKCYANYASSTSGINWVYPTYDEEQPGTAATQGTRN